MKRKIAAFAFALALLSACAKGPVDMLPQSPATGDTSVSVDAAIPFRLVGEGLSISETAQFGGVSLESFRASEMDGNYLFSSQSFEEVLARGEDLKAAIYEGNLVAVFDAEGIDQPFEQTMGLPIQFPGEDTETGQDDHITVACMYRLGDDGAVEAAQVAVPTDLTEEESFAYFLACAADFSGVEADKEGDQDDDLGRVGSARKYFAGKTGRGTLEVVYDLYFVGTVQGEDEYIYHAYMDGVPTGEGERLKGFTTKVGVFGTDVILYPPQPETTNTSRSYTVSLVPDTLGDLVIYRPELSWQVTEDDIDIARYREDESTYCWEIDLAKGHTGALHLEPGGRFTLPSGTGFTLRTQHAMTLEEGSGNEVEGTFSFLCVPQRAN